MWEFYLHFYLRDLQYRQILVLSFMKCNVQTSIRFGMAPISCFLRSSKVLNSTNVCSICSYRSLSCFTRPWDLDYKWKKINIKLSIRTLNNIPWTWIINASYRNMLYPQEKQIHFKRCFAICQIILYAFTHLSNFNILQLKPSIVTDCKQKTTIFLYIFFTEGNCWNINWIINIFLGK